MLLRAVVNYFGGPQNSVRFGKNTKMWTKSNILIMGI
jgi:hypothetical protein